MDSTMVDSTMVDSTMVDTIVDLMVIILELDLQFAEDLNV